MFRRLAPFAIPLFGLFFDHLVRAQPATERLAGRETSWSNLLAVGLNPGVLGDEARLRERAPLRASASPVGAINFVGAALVGGLSPVAARPGAMIEIQPLSILYANIGYEPTFYFGRGGARQSFPSVRSPAPTHLIGTPRGAHPDEAAVMHRLSANVTLQAKFGFVAVRTATRGYHVRTSLGPGDRAYYDPSFDLVVGASQLLIENETDVVVTGERGSIGLRGAALVSFVPASAYLPGEPRADAQTPTYRLGPIGTWRVRERPAPGGTRVDLFGLATFYLRSREHDGASTSAAIPYVLVGGVADGLF